MSEKKYISLNRLANYDALIKVEIAEGDTNAVSSAVNSSKSYTNSEINKLINGTNTVAKATSATSATSATKATQDGNSKDISSTYETKTDASTKLTEAKTYTDTKTSGLASTTVVDNKISSHNTLTSAHNDIRELISGLTTKLNNFLDVDDTTSDQLSEVLTLIENNKGTLESLTTSKINVSDIIDNLTTSNANKVLSAKQGVAIKSLIDALQTEVNGKASSDHTHNILYANSKAGVIKTGYESNTNSGTNYYFRPDSTNENDRYILGSSSNKWNRAYIDDLTLTNRFYANSGITLDNGIALKSKDSNGDEYNLIYLSGSNRLQLGYGMPDDYTMQLVPKIVISSRNRGSTLPDTGVTGQIFFKKA